MRASGDVAIPVVLAALATVELASLDVPHLPVAVAVEVAACALLVWRRHSTLAVCTTAALVLILLPYVGPALNEPAAPILIVALASFSLARHLPRRRGLLGMAVIFAALVVTQQITVSPPPDLAGAIFLLAILVPPYAFGEVLRRLDLSHATQTQLLLRQQEATRREAVADERARIARDLHDVLAHSISAMVVQAEAAQDLMAHQPDRAAAALREVTAAGRGALAETGQLLRLIRDTDNELGLAPNAGLDRLPELVEHFRRSGLEVSLRVDGSLHALPAAVDLAGYRIAQETMTNALRHGSDHTASLTIRRTPATLTITATNPAVGSGQRPLDRDRPGGLGLTGMRERVSGLGGELTHARHDDAYQLTAALPLTVDRT